MDLQVYQNSNSRSAYVWRKAYRVMPAAIFEETSECLKRTTAQRGAEYFSPIKNVVALLVLERVDILGRFGFRVVGVGQLPLRLCQLLLVQTDGLLELHQLASVRYETIGNIAASVTTVLHVILRRVW